MDPETRFRPRLTPPLRSACFLVVALAATLSGCAPEPEPIDEWRRYRGVNGQGVSADAPLPATWSEESDNIRFKTWTPGAANSSPVASGGRVFLTTVYGAPDNHWDAAWQAPQLQRVVMALDLESGEMLWQTSLFTGGKGKVHHTNTRASPTPVTDGEHVFVNFDNILAALDIEGNVLWQKDIDPDYYTHAHYGVSSSPILVGDTLVLQQDREESTDQDVGWIAAFDKKTGERLWRDEWTYTCCSYTTPILLDRGDGASELVMSSSKTMVAFDPATGERLWEAEHPSIQPVPSLLTDGDLLVAPGGIHETGLVVYRLTGSGAETKLEVLWQTHRAVPQIPTPLFYEGRLFTLKDNGVVTAYEAETGTKIWAGRASPGNYWPSLVAGDGKLYATNQYGVVSVIDARSDTFDLMAENAIADGVHGATPAIAGGCLLLRTKNHLYCIEASAEEEAAAAAAG